MKPAAGTWARMSNAAALDKRLSSEAFRVLGVLCCYADNTTFCCCPSVATIADDLGLKRRMVQLHLRRLEELGYVATIQQTRPANAGRRKNGARLGGGWAPNTYSLTFPTPPSLKRSDKVQPHCASSGTDKVQFGDTDKVQPHCTQTRLSGTRLGIEERNSVGEDSDSPVGVREDAGGVRGEAGLHLVEDVGTNAIAAGSATAPINGKLPWRTPDVIELPRVRR